MIHPKLKDDFRKAKEAIIAHSDIFLLTHHDPDGDALGSISAVSLALKRLGKNTKSFISGKYADRYNYLPLPLFEQDFNACQKCLFIVLDCADLSRTFHLSNLKKDHNFFIINIDHHPQDNKFGHINIVDTEATSASELVFFLILELGLEVDKDLAEMILTGIVADTGCFKHSNTTDRGLEIASFLAKKGASIKKIVDNLEKSKKLNTLKLWGKVLSGIKKNNQKGIVSAVITNQDLEDCGATKEDLEGVVNLIAAIPESKAALLLREDEEGNIKGSLRSDPDGLDVSRVASLFGGGGHVRASGFKIKAKIKETDNGWEIIGE